MPTIRHPADAAGMGAESRASLTQTAGPLVLGGVCALIIGGAFAAGQAARDSQGPPPTATASFGLRGLISTDGFEASPERVGLRGALADARDLECLTQAVYYESRGEPETGQAAVAQVVLNRTRAAGRYPGSVCGVVFQHARSVCQFSFACDGSVQRPRERDAWKRSRAVAQRALAGERRAGIGGATQFRVAGLSSFGLVRVEQIGAHVFYNLAHGVHARPHPARVTAQLASAPASAPTPSSVPRPATTDAAPVKVSASAPAAPASPSPAA